MSSENPCRLFGIMLYPEEWSLGSDATQSTCPPIMGQGHLIAEGPAAT